MYWKSKLQKTVNWIKKKEKKKKNKQKTMIVLDSSLLQCGSGPSRFTHDSILQVNTFQHNSFTNIAAWRLVSLLLWFYEAQAINQVNSDGCVRSESDCFGFPSHPAVSLVFTRDELFILMPLTQSIQRYSTSAPQHSGQYCRILTFRTCSVNFLQHQGWRLQESIGVWYFFTTIKCF